MASITSISTQFAPAERVPIEVVQRQADRLTDLSLPTQLLNSVLNYVFILNAQRQIIWASDSALGLVPGQSRKTLLGSRPGELFDCVHSRAQPGGCGTSEFCSKCGAVEAILGSLAGEKTVRECRMTRVINLQPEALDLLVCATPLKLNDESLCIFSVADVSHEKRRRAMERLFFHDLINGAGGLEGLIEVLQERAPDDLQPDLELARAGFRDLLEQIQAQKELMAAERNDLQPRPQTVQAGALLKDLVALYGRHLLAEGRAVRLAEDTVDLVFSTDLTLLRRVLGNLLKNALEASDPGQTVTAGCQVSPGQVRFWVRNQRVMPREAQLQVFNRSFSTKGAGRGLGTYSVRLLTERYLGGAARFTTTPEEGTTFFVELPTP